MSEIPTMQELFGNAQCGDIHGPDYQPHNVTIVPVLGYDRKPRFAVKDFDGTCYATADTRARAESMARVRKGVIKAAITRRRNKVARSS